MWTVNARADMKADFDAAIELAYGKGHHGELENLASLFSESALDAYGATLKSSLNGSADATASVGWIDKRPIAYLDKTKSGAELGDMMLIVNERSRSGNVLNSRACLLEAKQAKTESGYVVPVTAGRSTTRQLNLLSTWAKFSLKATATSSEYIGEDIDVKSGMSSAANSLYAHAWYIAVKKFNAKASRTSPAWMSAPSSKGATFEHTLGDIFTACALAQPLTHKNLGTCPVGRSFNRKITTGNSWDQLINSLIDVCKTYEMPPKHFPHSTTGRLRDTFGIAGVASIPADIDWKSMTLAITLTAVACWLFLENRFLRSYLRDRNAFIDFLLDFQIPGHRISRMIRNGAFPVLIFDIFPEGRGEMSR